jgi:CRP/FNR family transcriptional regulator, polysaccharide utilization system transcription regulator
MYILILHLLLTRSYKISCHQTHFHVSDNFLNIIRNCQDCPFRSPMFKLLSDDELRLVHKNKITVHFNKGETIRKQGTFMSHVISLNSGMAKLYLEGPGRRHAILRIVKPTSFIGGPGMYVDQIHHFSATALMETTVCFIDIQVFKQIINQNNQFSNEFMRDFSMNILGVYNRLISLIHKQMPGRIADSLLYLFDDVFEGSIISNHITKQDLADLSAMSKDSAVKVLRQFELDGVIRFGEKKLEVLDHDSLLRISRTG